MPSHNIGEHRENQVEPRKETAQESFERLVSSLVFLLSLILIPPKLKQNIQQT